MIQAQELYRDSIKNSAYKSYTFNYWLLPIDAPEAYIFEDYIDGICLGIGTFKNPFDIFITPEGEAYISDTGNHRVIHLDAQHRVLEVLEEFKHAGELDRLASPKGLYATEQALLIADTGNKRIVIFDRSGAFIRTIESPGKTGEAGIPKEFDFKPIRVVLTGTEKIYVISDGVYDGVMEFTDTGAFVGFIGAPRVKPNPIDLFWRRFSTKEQRESSVLFLPTEYESIHLDEKGFLFAVEAAHIRRLNPAGVDIFNYERKDTEYYTEAYGDITEQWKKPSRFTDVVTQSNNIVSVLDSVRGRIFTYDKRGKLLYVCGGIGATRSLFQSPSSLAFHEEHLYVVDQNLHRIIVLYPSDYARVIHRAIDDYEHGRYESAMEAWYLARSYNVNYELAYSGIGQAKLMNQEFSKAMDYFRLANDRENYSIAYQLYRSETLSKWFGLFLAAAVGLWLTLRVLRKKQLISRAFSIVPVPNQLRPFFKGIQDGFLIMKRPFDCFWELRIGRLGNLASSLFILLAYTYFSLLVRMNTAFIFNYTNPLTINALSEFFNTLILFILWCVVHWSLSVLRDGKGTFKQILMVTGYSLLPYILFSAAALVVGYFITLEEGGLIQLLHWAGIIWSVFLLFSGTATIQQYTASKTLVSLLLTVLGIGIVLFLALLFFSVIDLMWNYLVSVYTELVLRF